MAKNVTFTPAAIDALTKGKLRDPRTPGLMIEVLESGRKIWKYERRLIEVGAYVRLTLGRFPARTLADARAWPTYRLAGAAGEALVTRRPRANARTCYRARCVSKNLTMTL
jgi:hypothetical protein